MHLKRLCRLLAAYGAGLAVMHCPAHADADDAVTYQINPAHTGSVTTANLTPPLAKQWSIDLGGSISYPLIAGGKVFVTTATSGGSYGTNLYALDAATGRIAWGPVSLPGTYYFSAAAYDAGKLFVVNYDGLMRSFDAATGTPGWSVQLPGQYSFSSAPTAVGGVVYVGGAGSGGTLYAVSETNGAINWTASVENGDDSSPVVTDDGVYVSYAGPQTYKFDLSGGLIWHYDSGIEGGGGKTAVFYNGLLYARDAGVFVFDGMTGAEVGHTGSYNYKAPAFDAGREFTVDANGNVQGTDISSGNILWTFSNGSPNSVVTAPLVVNGFVYVGTSGGSYGAGGGTLFALNPSTGAQVWSDNVGAPIAGPDEQNVSQPLTGMAAGEGLLLVPAGHVLVAYSQLVRTWAATSLSVGGDGYSRLLWDNYNGTAAFWLLDPSNHYVSQQNYGPFPGWTAQSLSPGPDQNTRVQWSNPNGAAAFWRLDAKNSYIDQQNYGPYAGWSVASMSTGPDGDTRVLWTNASGQAALWRLDAGNRYVDQQNYGPYSGWTAKSVSTGPNGDSRVLWTNTDGTAAFWLLNPSNVYVSQQNYGPFSGWTATSLSAGADGYARAVWANTGGTMAFWLVDPANGYVSQQQYGPFAGWSARSLAGGAPDASSRALWANVSGQIALWDVDSSNHYVSQQNYGPF